MPTITPEQYSEFRKNIFPDEPPFSPPPQLVRKEQYKLKQPQPQQPTGNQS